ncbi:MAG: hypothetical protein AB1640_08065 [bacterium]
MPDLTTEFAGLRFKNPISAAAGPITSTDYTVRQCIETGAGSVVVKSVGLDAETQLLPRPGNWFLDRQGERGGLMHFYAGLLPLDRAVEIVREVKPLAEREDARLIGSFFFIGRWTGIPPFEPVSPPALLGLRRMAQELEAAGAEAIEVVCNCGLCLSASDTIGFQERAIPLVFEALKGHLRVPFWIKLGYSHPVFWLRDIRAMKDWGATAVHAYSDFRVTFLDIETARPPVALPFGYGRWLRGLACHAAYLSAHGTGLQVMSGGGIHNWRDAVERMMCGASIAALESAVQHRGYGVFREILEGMTRFMERKGYERSSDLVGLAAPHIDNPEEFMTQFLAKTVPPESLRTLVDVDKCNGCGLCSSCIYGAIVMEDKRPRIDLGACARCGACITLCPKEALAIVAAG